MEICSSLETVVTEYVFLLLESTTRTMKSTTKKETITLILYRAQNLLGFFSFTQNLLAETVNKGQSHDTLRLYQAKEKERDYIN